MITMSTRRRARSLVRPQAPGHPNRWHVRAVSQVAAFMALLDVSIVNVALPSIGRGLDTPAGTVQWVVSTR
jgi:hypothetical protein